MSLEAERPLPLSLSDASFTTSPALQLGSERSVSEMEFDMVAPALTATLLLANTSEVPLGYKAKTNAPRRWLVRPNIAAIPPGGTLRVSLSLLGPPGSLLAVSSLNEDRVLILSAPLEEEEVVEALEQRREIPSSLHEAAPAASVCRLSVRLLLQPPSALPSPRAGASSGSSSSGSRPLSVADAPRAPAASPPSTPSPPPRRADASPPDATPGFAQLAVAERVARLQRAHPPPHAGAADSGSGVEETSSSYLPYEEAGEDSVRSSPRNGAGSAAAGPDEEEDDEAAAARRERAVRWAVRLLPAARDGAAAEWVVWLARLFELFFAASDELEPWLKWKAYDVVWAALLLLLARRSRRIARLREVLDL